MKTTTKKRSGKTVKRKPGEPIKFVLDLASGRKADVSITDGDTGFLRRPLLVRLGGGVVPVSLLVSQDVVPTTKREATKVNVRLTCTFIDVHINDKLRFMACSVCKPPDRFNKKVGRRLALKHLFEKMRHRTGKWLVRGPDRKRIREAILGPVKKNEPKAVETEEKAKS